MAVDSYRVSAKYYDDAYATKNDLVDLPFYMDLAKRSGGPVLEMACGTGRILLPIARAGIEIHGVDNSLPMLEVLRSHVRQEPPEVQQRITIAEGDMRSFRSAQKYTLVTIPFRPMQHMYTVEDQAAALQTAAFHLVEGGLFAFDVFYPNYELLQSGIGEETLDLEWPLASDPGKIVRRYFRKETVDKTQQNFTATFLFRTCQGETPLLEETEPLKMSWYTYPQLRALFLLAGLEIVEEYGSFARRPLDNQATEMIFVLKKAA